MKHPDYICEYEKDDDGYYLTWYPPGMFDELRGEVFPTLLELNEALHVSAKKVFGHKCVRCLNEPQ